jgi:NDP-sugar pyrophosphorylase family protein
MAHIVGVILAAGLGMRLRPSTEKCPKPLIPVGGVEPLFFALYKLSELKVDKVLINTHYLSDKIEQAVSNWKKLFPKIEIRTIDENPEILGTGGALINITQKHSDWFSKDTAILLQNGDTLAQFDLGRLLQKPEVSCFAVSYLDEHLKKYNPLWVDENKKYAGIGKTPRSPNHKPAHFLGVHYLSPKAVQCLKNEQEFKVRSIDLFNGIYKPLNEKGMDFDSVEYFAKSPVSNEFWFDMTTQEFLLEAQRYVLDSLLSSEIWVRVLKKRFPQIQEYSPGVWVESDQKGLLSFRDNITFKSPVVFVETNKGPRELKYSKMTVGPHASLIHEKGSFVMGQGTHPALEVVNSVVFSDSSEKNNIESEKVCNQICVL